MVDRESAFLVCFVDGTATDCLTVRQDFAPESVTSLARALRLVIDKSFLFVGPTTAIDMSGNWKYISSGSHNAQYYSMYRNSATNGDRSYVYVLVLAKDIKTAIDKSSVAL